MTASSRIIIESKRDERTLDWIVQQVGWPRVDDWLASLPGNRKPYVSNLAKALGLVIPDSVIATPAEQARPELKRMLEILKNGQSRKI